MNDIVKRLEDIDEELSYNENPANDWAVGQLRELIDIVKQMASRIQEW